MAVAEHRGGLDDPNGLVQRFIKMDMIGAALGAVLVIVVNSAIVREPGVWLTLPILAFVIVCLFIAHRLARTDALTGALMMIAVGNWVAALSIAALLPSLWPVMVLTALMPLLLATPFIDARELIVMTAFAALVGGLVAVIGLLRDDSGVIPDIDDLFEVILVTGALVGHMVPMALIVRQQQQIQSAALGAAERLNDELRSSELALAASRRRVVEAGDRERNRIERDLHDGAQQRLIAVRLHLGLLTDEAATPEMAAKIDRLADDLGAALEELRELAHGIFPPVLETGGLTAALGAVIRRFPSRITFEAEGISRYPRPVETAMYFTALEALTNTAKYAPDADVTIDLHEGDRDDGTGRVLVLEIADDGPGFEPTEPVTTSGLLNMNDRIGSIDGVVEITTTPGNGVRLNARIPIASPTG